MTLLDFMESIQMRRYRKRLDNWQLVPWGHLAKILLAYPDFINFFLKILYNSHNFIYQSVHFSRSVMSDSLQPHGLQHTRPPCPSPTPGAYSNLCPSRHWCHPTISSSVVSFSHLQSFPASGSFPMSPFFASGGQSIGTSSSVLPMNIQDWFPLEWTGWISLCSPRDSQESSTPQYKSITSSVLNSLYSPTLTFIHDYWKNHSFD